MPAIDQFESVFKSADKIRFSIEPGDIQKILVVTDFDQSLCDALVVRVRSFLRSLEKVDNWQTLVGDAFSTVNELMNTVNHIAPDLIVTYRNLHTPVAEHPYSLGVFLDVLTQASDIPILVVPHPNENISDRTMENTDRVMVITDHLTGDHHLVSYAAHLTSLPGTLFLSHMEDDATFDRYVQTIARIPGIDTDMAARALQEQLLKEPTDFMQSCQHVLEQHFHDLRVQRIVTLGHHLSDYRRLVDDHRIDLLVMNTKDDDQLAMHGKAYPLSIELRKTPLLLL